jgi:hypothetical protein
VAHFHRLGLRERLLTLPVMVALVLTMIWRQIGSVTELVRLLRQEGFFWCSPVQVTEPALSQRLRTFPAELFERVLEDLLPRMHTRWAERARPLPLEIPGSGTAIDRCWSWTVPPWMPCCAKSACSGGRKAPRWQGG